MTTIVKMALPSSKLGELEHVKEYELEEPEYGEQVEVEGVVTWTARGKAPRRFRVMKIGVPIVGNGDDPDIPPDLPRNWAPFGADKDGVTRHATLQAGMMRMLSGPQLPEDDGTVHRIKRRLEARNAKADESRADPDPPVDLDVPVPIVEPEYDETSVRTLYICSGMSDDLADEPTYEEHFRKADGFLRFNWSKIRTWHGGPSSYAFAEYKTHEQAAAALKKLNRSQILGQVMIMQLSDLRKGHL